MAAVWKTVKYIPILYNSEGQLFNACATTLQRRWHHHYPASSSHAVKTATLIPGDGVGPELMSSVLSVFKEIDVPVKFEEIFVSEVQKSVSASLSDVIESIRKNGVCLKGVISSPHHTTGELETLNMQMRRALDLFANVVRVQSIPGYPTRHSDVDLVIIREQLEGEYSCLEHEFDTLQAIIQYRLLVQAANYTPSLDKSVKGVVESLKIITRVNSERIAKFAFDYAIRHGRKKVTAVHKANIMKLADGLFLESCEKVSELYPTIKLESMIIDNCCMQLVSSPQQFDVMVLPNLYGNIVDNLAAGLVGGAGVVPGENYSHECVIFEQGARHSYQEGVGRNIANPAAILLASSNMLRHLGINRHADAISNAVFDIIKSRKVRTKDMGGHATTTSFTNAVLQAVKI